MTENKTPPGYKQNLKDKIFRIKSAIRTVELKQVLTPGERDVVLMTMHSYAAVLDALLSDESAGDLIEIPREVADGGAKAIDEHLKKEKP